MNKKILGLFFIGFFALHGNVFGMDEKMKKLALWTNSFNATVPKMMTCCTGENFSQYLGKNCVRVSVRYDNITEVVKFLQLCKGVRVELDIVWSVRDQDCFEKIFPNTDSVEKVTLTFEPGCSVVKMLSSFKKLKKLALNAPLGGLEGIDFDDLGTSCPDIEVLEVKRLTVNAEKGL